MFSYTILFLVTALQHLYRLKSLRCSANSNKVNIFLLRLLLQALLGEAASPVYVTDLPNNAWMLLLR